MIAGMTQPIDYMTSASALGPNDRKTVLLVWGIILIIVGAGTGCVAFSLPLAMLAPRPAGVGGMPVMQLVMGIAIYLAGAVLLVWTGIGSIRCQRWCRPIVLVFCTLALISGVVGLIFTALILPATNRIMAATAPVANAPGAQVGMVIGYAVGMGCIGVLSIALPALMLWFYRDPAVRATVEFYDPHTRWTDGCPVPVLGASISLALAGVWLLTVALLPLQYSGWTVFRVILSIISALLAVALLAVAWLCYRQRPAGWRMGFALTILVGIWLAAFWLLIDVRDLYAASGIPAAQLDQLVDLNRRQRPVWFAVLAVAVIGASIYWMYIRRYFSAPPGWDRQPESPPR